MDKKNQRQTALIFKPRGSLSGVDELTLDVAFYDAWMFFGLVLSDNCAVERLLRRLRANVFQQSSCRKSTAWSAGEYSTLLLNKQGEAESCLFSGTVSAGDFRKF